MHYRVLAAGPIIAGNATIPHRVVLLAWSNGHPCLAGPVVKLSVHTQQFHRPEPPMRTRSTSLGEGDYFCGDDREIAAPLCFSARLTKQLERYGRYIDIGHWFDDYETARIGVV